MDAYSMDLRVRVMADVDAGMKCVDVAKKYSVSTDWIRKLKRFRRATGSFEARRQRPSHATKLDAELPRLRALVCERPDATLAELRERLEPSVSVSVSGVARALKRLGLTFKKRPSSPRSNNATTCSSGAPSGG